MLEKVFIEIMNMSLTASVIILAVMLARLLLLRAPRVFSYVLWAAVLFRLLCPISFTANISFLGILENEASDGGRMEYISQDIGYQMDPQVNLPIPAVNDVVNRSLPEGNPAGSVNPLQVVLYLGARLWILGILIILSYSLISLFRLQQRLKMARWEETADGKGIYRLEGKGTPFVYGLLRPRIYFPSDLAREEEGYILLHEEIHIRRGDHVFRLLACLALCLHWFNPLVWLAFSLSGRDMEMSCDEAVIRRIGGSVKKEYSESLLALASGKRIVKGIPLAFGEGDTKSRIKNVLSYKKPATILVGVAVITCIILAVMFISNPEKETENSDRENVFYGIVDYLDAEGENLPVVVRIPRMGDVEIPEAEEILPYIEIDFHGLEIGDLIRISFSKNVEVSVMETYPAMFSEKAEKIEVMGRGPFGMTYVDADRYRFSIPLSMASEAQAGDLLEIYHHAPEIDGQEPELLTSVPVQSVEPEFYQIWVELSTEEVETFLSEYGFGIQCRLVREPSEHEENPKENQAEEQEQDQTQEREPEYLAQEHFQNDAPVDGTYQLNIRSISRSARGIERYVMDNEGEEDELPFLAFADDCTFQVNEEMAAVHYREVSLDEFADIVNSDYARIGQIDPFCISTFQDGLITQISMESSEWYIAGITYEPFAKDTWYQDIQDFPEMEGKDPLKEYYSLSGTEQADFGEGSGLETAEIYTGNIGDGDSGIVLFKDASGAILYSEGAHVSRAGWNNIYLGELDGTAFLMRLHIEDRDEYGEYNYQVFRLGASGEILQIAGSSFTWNDGSLLYEDEIFRQWADDMSYYLEACRLLLSSQDGEIRTERISEGDKYHYETLRRGTIV